MKALTEIQHDIEYGSKRKREMYKQAKLIVSLFFEKEIRKAKAGIIKDIKVLKARGPEYKEQLKDLRFKLRGIKYILNEERKTKSKPVNVIRCSSQAETTGHNHLHKEK